MPPPGGPGPLTGTENSHRLLPSACRPGKLAELPSQPPLTATARTDYCAYVASLLRSYPAIHDVVIWNEANQTTFWPSPSPVAYERPSSA